ncbi:ENAH [Mytilus edulis]|uniref:ENAH n=1 Tax=Mytilus edulis TaxID=6550 RepID=A0A8S3TJK9_MYTED|nr:ENAH [Mytilus edulis]
MEIPDELNALLAAMKLTGEEPAWKFSASSDQVSVQLTWTKTKAKEPEASSSKSKPALKSKPPSTRRRDAKRLDQWKATKTAVIPADEAAGGTPVISNRNTASTSTNTTSSSILPSSGPSPAPPLPSRTVSTSVIQQTLQPMTGMSVVSLNPNLTPVSQFNNHQNKPHIHPIKPFDGNNADKAEQWSLNLSEQEVAHNRLLELLYPRFKPTTLTNEISHVEHKKSRKCRQLYSPCNENVYRCKPAGDPTNDQTP